MQTVNQVMQHLEDLKKGFKHLANRVTLKLRIKLFQGVSIGVLGSNLFEQAILTQSMASFTFAKVDL